MTATNQRRDTMIDNIIRKPLVKAAAFLLSVVRVVTTGLTMLAFYYC